MSDYMAFRFRIWDTSLNYQPLKSELFRFR